MQISRNLTVKLLFLLDSFIPPILRDSKFFMWLPFRLLFGSKAHIFMDFKKKVPYLSLDDISDIYRETASVHIARETDINDKCLSQIKNDVVGGKVLDVACGRGFLAGILAERYDAYGVDFVIPKDVIERYPNVSFDESPIESMPFVNNYFDTVISAHTIEHVSNPSLVVAELRRVAKNRLIVVLPKQQSNLYTFDLHINFYPYQHDVLRLMNPGSRSHKCFDCGGDWYYVEDI